MAHSVTISLRYQVAKHGSIIMYHLSSRPPFPPLSFLPLFRCPFPPPPRPPPFPPPSLPGHYEMIFLVHEGRTDETPAVIEKITEMVKDARGTVWRVNDWGMRRLAYRIQKTWQAQYILMNIEVPSDKIAAIEKVLLQDERVIRHLVTKQDKAERKDYPAPVMYNAVGSGGDESDDDEDEEEDEDDEEDWEDEDEDEEDEEEEGEESEGKRLPAEVTSPLKSPAGNAPCRKKGEMGSNDESERKKRPSAAGSIMSPPAKRPSLSCLGDEKKVCLLQIDPSVLQFQNQKLSQQLEVQKERIHELESRFEDLKARQSDYDDTLMTVNSAWNQAEAAELLRSTHEEFRSEVSHMRAKMDEMHLQHRSLSLELSEIRDLNAKSQAEVRRVSDHLEDTLMQLESTRRKLVAAKQSAASSGPGAFPASPSLVKSDSRDGGQESRIASGEARELEAALEEAKSASEDEQRIKSSRPYSILAEQLIAARAEAERNRLILEQLQVSFPSPSPSAIFSFHQPSASRST
ncbi:unnamed protein product [Closterium sp. NIES-65]|nr:unnamed protein product [Closterium sp. NIES-65]